MAEGRTAATGAKRQEVRGLIKAYTDLVGPGGITAYVAPQDLLVLTDFDTVLVTPRASHLIPMYVLRSVTDYAMQRREYPGTQILCANSPWESTDIRNRSVLSEKSIHVMEVCALAQAQKALGEEGFRSRLVVKSRHESHVVLGSMHGIDIHVGRRYFDAILDRGSVDVLSGVLLPENEPTKTWSDLPLKSKGVYFAAHNMIYGLVMPHADIQRNRPHGGAKDQGAGGDRT